MSTIDKVNLELNKLKDDLSLLNSFTDEIGKAKDASDKVIKLADTFLGAFQKSVAEINVAMNDASSEFQKECKDAGAEFEEAKESFKKGISQAQASLGEIESKLTTAASSVNDLATKIDQINILGHFERIHSSTGALSTSVERNYSDLKQTVESAKAENLREFKSLKRNQAMALVGIAILVGTAIIGLLIFMRLMGKG